MEQIQPGQGRLVVVAGATGYLGKYVVKALHRDGWVVRALVRDESRLGDARASADEVFVGQATNAESLKGLFDGAEAAFSSIGIRTFSRHPSFLDVDYRANMNLAQGAQSAGVKRFVFISVFGGPQLRRLSPVAEARERVADYLRDSPMQDVVLRPTGFFNDMADIFKMARNGKVWMVGSGETKINPIHGADLADVVAEKLADQHPDQALEVGGPDVFTQIELADLAFRILGKPPRYGRVSPKLIRFGAKLIQPFNGNAAGFALALSMFGEMDAVGQKVGNHHLEEFYKHIAVREA